MSLSFDAETVHNDQFPSLLGERLEESSLPYYEAPSFYTGLRLKYMISGTRTRNRTGSHCGGLSGWTETETYDFEKELTLTRVPMDAAGGFFGPLRVGTEVTDIDAFESTQTDTIYESSTPNDEGDCMIRVVPLLTPSLDYQIHDPKKPGVEFLRSTPAFYGSQVVGVRSSTKQVSNSSPPPDCVTVDDVDITSTINMVTPQFSRISELIPDSPDRYHEHIWGLDFKGETRGELTSGWSATDWRDLTGTRTVEYEDELVTEGADQYDWVSTNVKWTYEWELLTGGA